MKVSGETKLLLILGLIVLLGGGSLMLLNRPVTPPAPPPPPKALTAADFDALFKGARHVKGDPDAKIKVIEFADFECPSCRTSFNEFLAKEKNLPVAFAFRHYPLDMHPDALPAAVATEAAAKQSKFWPMYEALFTGKEPALKKEDIQKAAQKIGLDIAQFQKDLQDPKIEELVRQEMAEAQKYNISMTPTFLVRDASGKVTSGTGTEGLQQLLPLMKGESSGAPVVGPTPPVGPDGLLPPGP